VYNIDRAKGSLLNKEIKMQKTGDVLTRVRKITDKFNMPTHGDAQQAVISLGQGAVELHVTEQENGKLHVEILGDPAIKEKVMPIILKFEQQLQKEG
jgi:hypothetical protein